MTQLTQTGVSITVAPNGARRGRHEHPALPVSPEELAVEARACRQAGASILHLHVRDAAERHSLDVGRYREAIAAVREVCDLVIQPTTERAGLFAPEDMMAVFRGLRPEMISFNLGELLGDGDRSACARVCEFLAEVELAGTVPQYIVYEPAELDTLRRWHADGWLPQVRPYILIVLGRHRGTAAPGDLLEYLARLPDDWRWGVCAFGSAELACVLQAALLGGHCRVGFENNLVCPRGRPLADNAEQVARLAALLDALGKEVMTPARVREYFDMPPGVPHNY